MSIEINYENNPLNGVGLKKMLIEIIDYYSFEILFAYLNINCFKMNPSLDSSIKFLKKTQWAREKVEAFYLYEYKNLPRASDEQFLLSPRDRIIPDHQTPGEPAELSIEDAERLREKRANRAKERDRHKAYRSDLSKGYRSKKSANTNNQDKNESTLVEQKPTNISSDSIKIPIDPWANWKNKSDR
ncbi:MAG TPA: DUF2132 domain-containing protein [Aeromonadales bacterium]|nr:DUF2132 domain-containing protein [Aeromonadales bacterium]